MAKNNYQLIIKKEDIANTLSHLVGIVEKRNAIQQLAHVKLATKSNNEVEFTTTDMDISITECITADQCSLNVSFTLPAITLYDIIKKFPTESLIHFKQNKHNIEITAGTVFFALPFLDSNDFPAIEEGDLPISFTLLHNDFFKLFNRTKFVISTEDSRYNLTGLYLHTNDSELKAATTDGHRLALTIIKNNIEDFGILISRKTVMELVKIADKINQDLQVFISNNKVKFICGRTILVSKLIAAEFPNYQDVIPKEYSKNIKVNKEELIAAIDRVSAIYMDKSKSVLLSLDKSLTISASASDSSNAHETLAMEYEGEKFDIYFNYTYLLEMLQHIEGNTVKMLFNNNQSPTLIENNETIYIIMPMAG